MAPAKADPNGASLPWLVGGGETGALVRSLDWSSTPLGPVESWPASLRVTVGILLHSRHPMFLWWGPELVQIYNDAYVPSFGRGKHPAAMGQRGRDCWREIWPIIGPQIEDVMSRAKASWNEDHLVPVWRNERIEEVYWTYGYSPVFGESGGVEGTLVVCTETTARVVAERRLRTIRKLADETALARSGPEVMTRAAGALREAPADAPFALLYYSVPGGDGSVLSQSLGLDEIARMAADSALRPRLASIRAPERIELEVDRIGVALPGSPWPEPATSAFVVPIGDRGFLVVGLSPRLMFDDPYRDYVIQLANHVGLAFGRIESEHAREVTALERNNLLLQAPVPTALFRGPEHVFELANTHYCRMVNRFDIVGKSYRDAFPELVHTALPGILDRVYQTGEPFTSGELPVQIDRRGDGTLEDRFFMFSVEALRDPTGKIYGMMAIAVEITEQVGARREIERTQREREGLLRDLESAGRAKDEFLAMLGHELRNPLSPIVTALHLMKRRGDGRGVREYEIIERQVGHLTRLVDDLLDVSKITRGKVALRKEVLEMSEVVSKALEMASDLLEQRRHRLSIDVPRDGLRVEGDPVRLAQVVANLLTNAARYTDPGGLVSVTAANVEDEVVLTVKDSGVGIGPALLPRVFDLFVQGQRSTDRKEGGLGLGLSLVKSLVTMHEGTVVARSEGPGAGSEFEIRLPSTEKARGQLPPGQAAARLAGSVSKRVLVVDDNLDSAEMLRALLQAAGHEVALADDGPSALVLAEEFLPDVALLDIGLPVMDGYELGKRLRQSARGAGCRLIALSGYGQEHDRAQSQASGFEAHLVKPVDLDAVLQLVAGNRRP